MGGADFFWDHQRGKWLKPLSRGQTVGRISFEKKEHKYHIYDNVRDEGNLDTPAEEIRFDCSTGKTGSVAQIQWQ
jgi:hypothetical protein